MRFWATLQSLWWPFFGPNVQQIFGHFLNTLMKTASPTFGQLFIDIVRLLTQTSGHPGSLSRCLLSPQRLANLAASFLLHIQRDFEWFEVASPTLECCFTVVVDKSNNKNDSIFFSLKMSLHYDEKGTFSR